LSTSNVATVLEISEQIVNDINWVFLAFVGCTSNVIDFLFFSQATWSQKASQHMIAPWGSQSWSHLSYYVSLKTLQCTPRWPIHQILVHQITHVGCASCLLRKRRWGNCFHASASLSK
jgi:hypothetical protein